MQRLREHGVRFVLVFGRQAFKRGDKFHFWGGLLVEAVGAGRARIKLTKLDQEC